MKVYEYILPPVPSSMAVSLVMLATLQRMAEKKDISNFFQSCKIEVRKHNRQHVKYLNLTLTFD